MLVKLIVFFVLEAVVVAVGTNWWCSRAAKKASEEAAKKNKGYGLSGGLESQWRVGAINGEIHIVIETLIQSLRAVSELYEKQVRGKQ